MKAHLVRIQCLAITLKRELPIKKKKKRKLDSSGGAKEFDHCWDLSLVSQIQARIEHDSEFRRELLKSSERWSERAEDVGSLQESLDKLQGDDASAALADFDCDEEMRDVDDGLLCRAHLRLGREGAIYVHDEHGTEHQVVKLCFIAYLDGIETANPLGVARGSHSMECVYVALLNLPLRMRYRMENLFPVTLCHTSTLKRFGTRAMIGGRGGGDDDLDQPRSLGAVMRKLDAGISLKFPSAEAEGGYEDRWCCAKMQTMPNGHRRAGLRPGTPCPSAGQCRPTAGHSVPSAGLRPALRAPVQASAGLRPALPCPSAGRAGLRPGTPCPSAGLRPALV